MRKALSVIAVGILLLCIFNTHFAVVLGFSPFLLIGSLAFLAICCIWVGPVFAAADQADWRYEKRLVRRPGV